MLTSGITYSISLDIQEEQSSLSSTPSTIPKTSSLSYLVTSKEQVIVSNPPVLHFQCHTHTEFDLEKDCTNHDIFSGGRLCPSFRKTWGRASHLRSGSNECNHSHTERFVRRHSFGRLLRSGSHDSYRVRCFSRGRCCGHIKGFVFSDSFFSVGDQSLSHKTLCEGTRIILLVRPVS